MAWSRYFKIIVDAQMEKKMWIWTDEPNKIIGRMHTTTTSTTIILYWRWKAYRKYGFFSIHFVQFHRDTLVQPLEFSSVKEIYVTVYCDRSGNNSTTDRLITFFCEFPFFFCALLSVLCKVYTDQIRARMSSNVMTISTLCVFTFWLFIFSTWSLCGLNLFT